MFDTVTAEWSAVEIEGEIAGGTGPGPRSSHSCAKVGDSEFYMFGGMSADDTRQQLKDDLWRFRLTTPTAGWWEEVATGGFAWDSISEGVARPGMRSDHTLVAAPDQEELYLLGGCNTRVARPLAWRLNLNADKWEPLPMGSSPGVVDASAGAEDPDAAQHERTTYLLDSARLGLRAPSSRCAHTASLYDGDILVFGGRVSVTVSGDGSSDEMWSSLGDMWRLRTASSGGFKVEAELANRTAESEELPELWSTVEDIDGLDENEEGLLLNRSDHAALVHDGTLYVFGVRAAHGARPRAPAEGRAAPRRAAQCETLGRTAWVGGARAWACARSHTRACIAAAQAGCTPTSTRRRCTS